MKRGGWATPPPRCKVARAETCTSVWSWWGRGGSPAPERLPFGNQVLLSSHQGADDPGLGEGRLALLSRKLVTPESGESVETRSSSESCPPPCLPTRAPCPKAAPAPAHSPSHCSRSWRVLQAATEPRSGPWGPSFVGPPGQIRLLGAPYSLPFFPFCCSGGGAGEAAQENRSGQAPVSREAEIPPAGPDNRRRDASSCPSSPGTHE